MTEYTEERMRRLRARRLLQFGVVVAGWGALAVKIGPLVPSLVVVGAGVLVRGVVAIAWWRDRRQEAARRRDGLPPSWVATFPVVFAQLIGATPGGRHARTLSTEIAEYYGRLSYANGELRWVPARWSTTKTRPVTWDASWSRTIAPLGKLTTRGCLTLTAPDGTVVDVYVRQPKDLGRVLGL